MHYAYSGGYGLYLLFSLPALLLGLWAQYKVKSAFSKYSKQRNSTGYSGAQVARQMLSTNGLNEIEIEETKGLLSDHYDPSHKVLRLSPEVYRGNSVAAAGVAAHEVGHALQDQHGYLPLRFRSFLVPSVQIGSWLGPIIFMLGLILSGNLGTSIAWLGLIIFGGTAVFALVTLPVEFDATRRAKEWLSNTGVVYQSEMAGIHRVLDAAALTYVASAVQAVTTILYYVFLLSGRRRN